MSNPNSHLQAADGVDRKAYSAPSLIEYGSLGDITLNVDGTAHRDNNGTGNDKRTH